MPQNINSASRLYDLITKISARKDAENLLVAWASVLEVQDENPLKKCLGVCERLLWANQELQTFQLQMRATSFPELTWLRPSTHAENLFSPMHMHVTVQHMRSHLGKETLAALEIFAEALPNEESTVKSEDLAEMARLIDDLEASLDESQLPEQLVVMFRRHIFLMRRALAEYPLRGVKAFTEALASASGDFIVEKNDLQENSKTDEVGKFVKAWTKMKTAIDVASTLEKAVLLGHEIWNVISQL
jgi:hypothetical protein